MKIQGRKCTKTPCDVEGPPTGPYLSFPVEAPSPHHGGLASPLGICHAQQTATFLLPAHDSLLKAVSYTVVCKQINHSFIVICDNRLQHVICVEHDSIADKANQQLPIVELS